MQLSVMRQTVKGFYGAERSTTADGLFTDAILNDVLNRGHHWFAERSRCYYAEFTTNLPLGTTGASGPGTSVVTLDTTLIELDLETVEFAAAGLATWTGIPFKPKKELRNAQAARSLRNVSLGTPTNFFIRPGAADNAGRVLELHPGANAAVTNGFKYSGWVYPPDMSADADVPELQPAEHWKILAAGCWQLALLERSRGRQDAPVTEWYNVANYEALTLRETLWRGHQGVPRTAEVGLTLAEDALARRLREFAGGMQGMA